MSRIFPRCRTQKCNNQLPGRKHVGPPEARAIWAGEEGPTLNVVFTNSNRQILLVIALK